MARCLIIGCGCRGLSLARALMEDGHAARGTTRDALRAAAIEEQGAEAVVGDPDKVATLAQAFEHVAVACLLLGSAEGPWERLAALHGPRLEMMLTRMLDSTVRGIVYEATGSVDDVLLAGGAERVRTFCEDSRIPYALISESPGDSERWRAAALDAVGAVLSAPALSRCAVTARGVPCVSPPPPAG